MIYGSRYPEDPVHFCCVYASRKDGHTYTHTREEIMARFGESMVIQEEMPQMGHYMYMEKFKILKQKCLSNGYRVDIYKEGNFMKRRLIILTGALLTAVSVSSAGAEETVTEVPAVQEEDAGGLLETLFGEGGPLADVLPEGTDIGVMVDTVKEEMNQADSEISDVFSEILEKAQGELGDFSTDALKDYAGSLLEQVIGGGDFGFGSLDDYIDTIALLDEAEDQYILDHNAGSMDIADVQIALNSGIDTSSFESEDDEIITMRNMIQYNYHKDDEGSLLFVSGSEDTVMFVHGKDEDGNYYVVEAVFAEDGENYETSLEAMCDRIGTGLLLDECLDQIAFNKASIPDGLKQWLEDHPEIKGIEYDGEIRTAEELDAIYDANIEELYCVPEEESLTE